MLLSCNLKINNKCIASNKWIFTSSKKLLVTRASIGVEIRDRSFRLFCFARLLYAALLNPQILDELVLCAMSLAQLCRLSLTGETPKNTVYISTHVWKVPSTAHQPPPVLGGGCKSEVCQVS